VPWSDIKKIDRWTSILRPSLKLPAGFVELGEICRVHRGQVTGNNHVWIAGPHAGDLPDKFLIPTITKARELLDAGEVLINPLRLRRVINLPADLDEIDTAHQPAVRSFLAWAKDHGADRSYIAQHRSAWWAVGLKEPAPIVCTYMARRPPAFVRNPCGARHTNIAHGLYPRKPLTDTTLDAIAKWLRSNVKTEDGRTYAGGLTKFEPRELERVPVPSIEHLPV
jgi:hypothetical protein